MSAASPLPEYDSPPVSEVLLSVEFLPLNNWHAPHAGRYWALIGKDYPTAAEAPVLPSQIEKFGEELRRLQTAGSHIQFIDTNATRSWFISPSGTRLIQIQRDRFIINWRKAGTDEIYPRYENEMRPRLQREWGEFQEFARMSDLGAIEVQQCEVTYVNIIPRGEGWQEFSEALTLLSCWKNQGSEGFLPAPEATMISGSFLMPRDAGRLHFSVQRVLLPPAQQDGVQIQLSARGRPASGAMSDILAWMDMGREWVVRGFTDLTTPEAHKLWKRRI
jgi:uncharacterized protein (TIGR04255 family)